MSFDIHPILEPGDRPAKGVWYAISPEPGENCSAGPDGRVGASASSYARESGGYSAVWVSAGATLEGPLAELHQLKFAQNEIAWTKFPCEGLSARYEHASFASGSGEVGVFAGGKLDGPLNDMWKYDTGGQEWREVNQKGQVPSPRTFHSSSSSTHSGSNSPDLVVFSGGKMGSDPVADRKVYMFDADLNEWKSPDTAGTPPSPRQGHVAAVLGGVLYVHGGMAGQTFLDDLHCLDLKKLEWSKPDVSGTCPPPLAAHGSAVVGTCLYMFGGWSSSDSGLVARDVLHCLHTDVLQWEHISIIGPPPPARFDFAMCAVKIPVGNPGPADTTSSGHDSVKADEGKNTGVDITSHTPASQPEETEDTVQTVRGNLPIERSFQAITIVDPEGVSSTKSAQDSLPRGANRVASGVHQHGGELHWMDVLYIFGGIDSSGEVHSDSFLIAP